jgi:hypothetical protein
MSTRISLGRVMAAGVIAVLAAIGPVQSVSAEPFFATGQITTIDDGDTLIKAAGSSGRFIVRNRDVGGLIAGSIAGIDFPAEPFTFTFKTNVPIQTQSGNIQGYLSFGPYEAKVLATSELGLTPLRCEDTGMEKFCVQTPEGLFFPGLLINGSVRFTEGAEGTGTVSAFVIPQLNEQGHIISVIAGGLTIQGE